MDTTDVSHHSIDLDDEIPADASSVVLDEHNRNPKGNNQHGGRGKLQSINLFLFGDLLINMATDLIPNSQSKATRQLSHHPPRPGEPRHPPRTDAPHASQDIQLKNWVRLSLLTWLIWSS